MSDPQTNEHTPLKVLVVDDTATNRMILQVFLRKLKLTVITADDGVQGVAAFERESPDLVIMDVMMPVMDGFEATRRIKALAGERWVPVIFLSALDKEENLVAGLDAGGDDYLHKPVNFVILEAKMRSLSRALATQRALDYERRRASAISDNLIDGVMTIDELGIIQWSNPAVEAMFGYTRAELVGQHIKLLMPEPDHGGHDGYLSRYLGGDSAKVVGRGQRAVHGRRKNGETFPMDLGVAEMQVAGHRQFVGVVRDTTERVAADKQLADNAERLQIYHDSQEVEAALALKIVGRQMQRSGLQDPQVQHWLAPAAHFSGDIVAARRCPKGHLYAMLADATGHGLGAAICTLPVLTLFYGLSEAGVPLNGIIHEINSQLCGTLPVGYFVAATVLRVAADGRSAEIWIGGTPNTLLLTGDGKVKQTIPSSNLPLGIDQVPLKDIEPLRVELLPDDQFIVFSDGLPEAANADGVDFGYEQLLAALALATPRRRIDSVQRALTRHMGTRQPHDDVSILAIAVAPTATAA